MGKSCINFGAVDELPLGAIEAILAAAPNATVERGTLARQPAKRSSRRT
jgi:hypothetical protein